MRKNLSAFLLLVFIFGSSGSIQAEDAKTAASTPVLAIDALGGNPADIPGWQPSLGQGISSMLIETLEGSDHTFQVLESTESTPARAGSGGGKAINETAGPAASDFTFGGEVAQFAVDSNGGQVGQVISSSPLAGLSVNVISAHVQIAWRIEDTATRKIIKRGTAEGSGSGAEFDFASVAAAGGSNSAGGIAVPPKNNQADGKDASSLHSLFGGMSKAFGGGHSSNSGGGTTGQPKTVLAKVGGDATQNPGGTIGYGNPTFMSSALGKATAAAVTNLIQQLDAIRLPQSGRAAGMKAATAALKHTPGKVLAVAGKDTIIVSLGSKEGLKEGDKLTVFQPTEIKDDKGNVVFTDEKRVGEITLSQVQEDRSRGSFEGDAEVQQGWTVKAK